MSVAFPPARPRTKGEVTQQAIQKMLDENNHLIQCIVDCQSKGKTAECTQYQQILHRNLVYLATIADSNQNMQSLLPAPPTPNMSMGPGGMGPSGGHAPNNLNDGMAPGPPPTSMMQSQMSNGHGEYSYQQSSYGEQGYDRSFDDSSQHYYEGGNSQYSQQQAQYQQGSGQQTFSQQQYSSQQGYGGQPQGYGAGQAGSSQYPQYQQGQSSGQYASYRSSQGGAGAPTQRPYAYETGQYGNYQQ